MYGIHRIEKRSRSDVYGIQLEANRTRADYLKGREFPASDIDWLKTSENVFLIKTDNWNKAIKDLIKDYDLKERKNSVVLLDSIYTASSEFFKDKSKAEIIEYFKECLEFHKKAYGDFIINAVIHFDEVKHGNNVHMHVASAPIVKNKKDNSYSLSARELMGGREHYRKRQDEFYNEVSSLWGLERGEVKDYSEVRKHIDKLEYEMQNAKIQAERAKAELNIRERVKNACEPIEDIKIRKSKIGNTVSMDMTDYEKLKARAQTSQDLKNGLAALEKYAHETKDALAIEEKVITSEREKIKAQAKCRQLEKSLEQAQQNMVNEKNRYNEQIKQLEQWFMIVKNWLIDRKLLREFNRFLERIELERTISQNMVEEDIERERELDYEEYEIEM